MDHEPIEVNAAGYWAPARGEIHIDSGLPMLQRVKTLAHELAHALAGHGLGNDRTPVRVAETVAESVAFLVCDALGLDTSERSFPYVARFSRDLKTFRVVLGEIHRVSRMILNVVQPRR